MLRSVLFDFDGTLFDTAEDILDCLRLAYKQCEVRLAEDTRIDRNLIGPPLAEMIRIVTPDMSPEMVESVANAFKRLYDSSTLSKTRPFEGIEELLSKLKSTSVDMFIVTNKRLAATQRILKKFQIHCFKDVYTSDSAGGKIMSKAEMMNSLLKTRRLDIRETIMIGDSADDITSAHENQVRAAAVLAGYGDVRAICEARPEYIIPQHSMILGILLERL